MATLSGIQFLSRLGMNNRSIRNYRSGGSCGFASNVKAGTEVNSIQSDILRLQALQVQILMRLSETEVGYAY